MAAKYFQDLPIDILYIVIYNLNNFELRAFLISCKSIYNRSLFKSFWRRLVLGINPNYPISLRNINEIRKCYLKANFEAKCLRFLKIKNIKEVIDNKRGFYSLDFDIYFYSISLWNQILEIPNDNLDRRDLFRNFFKYPSPERIKSILNRTDLKVILNIPQIDCVSNVNLLEIYFSRNKEFISNTKYSTLLIQCHQNNDEECFYYLYEKALRDNNFLRNFCVICIQQDEVELCEFGLSELYSYNNSIFDLLEYHGSIISYNIWQIIIDDYYEDFYFYFKRIIINSEKLLEKIYNEISGLNGIDEVRILYLKYLLSIPLSKYRTQEENIINKISTLINTIKDPYELGDILKL